VVGHPAGGGDRHAEQVRSGGGRPMLERADGGGALLTGGWRGYLGEGILGGARMAAHARLLDC
jgi:hypothetical protein